MKSAASGGWTAETELLAQIVEEISILASDKRREEPRTIPRPNSSPPATPRRPGSRRTHQPSSAGQEQASPRLTGHRQMLMAAMQRGMVRSE